MLSKSHLFGLISLTCILGAHPSALASTQVQPSPTPHPSSQLLANAGIASNLAETLYQTFTEIEQQPCDDRKTITERGIMYRACTANAGGRGQYRFISVASSVIESGDGIGYWYYLSGKVAAIRFFHTGELFMFDPQGNLQGELIPPQKVIINGVEEFQNRSIRTTFAPAERQRLEKLAAGGGKDIRSRFAPPVKPRTKQTISQSDGTSSHQRQCPTVINRNIAVLEAIPNVEVTANSQFAELTVPYPDPTAGLYLRYIFAMKGSGLDQLWQSPELMIEITRQIINRCPGTAVVTFGRDHSGDSVNVGLFPDGAIKRFSCAPDFERRTNIRTPMNWGEQACDL
jgi:hypothetical protein